MLNGDTTSFDYMGDVPDRVCNGNISGGSRSYTHYFNTNCYVNPPADANGIAIHRGNERRNNLTGPVINNFDLSLGKAFGSWARDAKFKSALSPSTFSITRSGRALALPGSLPTRCWTTAVRTPQASSAT